MEDLDRASRTRDFRMTLTLPDPARLAPRLVDDETRSGTPLVPIARYEGDRRAAAFVAAFREH